MIADHPHPFDDRWRAHWIWHGRPAIGFDVPSRPTLANPVDTVVLFRRVIDLTSVPTSAPCRLWVDGRYVLAVNGTEVARGPVRSDPRRAHYDVVDLAPFLAVGENVVAITARHFGVATSWWTPVPPSYSLGAGSLVVEALIGEEWIVSDRSWSSCADGGWSPVQIPGDVAHLPMESFDRRAHPVGWADPGFDASGWARAREILPVHLGADGTSGPPSDPYGALLPPVRAAFPDGAVHHATAGAVRIVTDAARLDDPVAQVCADEAGGSAGAEGRVTIVPFDLGRIAAGNVEMTVRGAVPGTIIDVAASEHVGPDGELVTLGQHAGFRYVCSGESDERFVGLDVIGTRHLHASIRVPDGGPAPELDVAIHDRHRPRPDGASFECSDPVLNRIAEVGRRTVDLCALDAYVDCPTREQRAWTGDSVVHQMVDLVTNPDWSMARWHPQLAAAPRSDGILAMAAASDMAADDRSTVPDWSLHWVRSVHNLYRYTGDRTLVAELLPVVERALRWFETYLRADGLVHNVPGWVLLDWASVYPAGCSSTLNALWARALEDFADMSEWIGNGANAGWARGRLAGVAAGFEVFWDEARGVYVDHVVDGVVRPEAAQHPGAAALAAGIVPADRRDRVVAGLVDRGRLIRHSWAMDSLTVEGGTIGFQYLISAYPEPTWDPLTQMVEAEPFFRYVVHDGLARAGRSDLIAELCRDWSVFLDAGETTWPECWVGGTRCHGWSSTPTRDLIVHTLGITPAEPGYASVRVAPALGGLEWAKATVPTPHGPVTVLARADGTVEVDSPIPVVRDS